LAPTSTSRRRFLKIAAATGSLAVGADASLLEPNHPVVTRVEIPLVRLPREFDGFTIVQLSDFHFDPYFSAIPIRNAVRIARYLNPDLVALTGDFVSAPVVKEQVSNNRASMQAYPCSDLLKDLRAREGIWAVMGNHDAATSSVHVQTALKQAGIQVLSNRAVPIERGGRRFWLAGIDDVLIGTPDLKGALRDVPPSEPVVLLVHEPDFADRSANHSVDLQLSGHSHGGQVRIPWVGAIYLPPMGRKYPRGLRKIKNLMLYTNVGLGTLYIPVRFACAPEITFITLKSLAPA
jgi:predicted MPP superfamily phosphohydrolase